MEISRATPMQKLRARPLSERRVLGTALYCALAVVIIASWVSSFRTSLIPPAPSPEENIGGNGGNTAPSLSQLITPFQSLKTALETAVSDFRRTLTQSRDLVEGIGGTVGSPEALPLSGNPDEPGTREAQLPLVPAPAARPSEGSSAPRIADAITRIATGRSHFVPALASAVAPPPVETEVHSLAAAVGETLITMWRTLTR